MCYYVSLISIIVFIFVEILNAIMLKKYIYIIFTVLFSLIFSIKSEGQCFNLTYSSCVTLGSTVVVSPDNGLFGFWEITDPSGSVITPGFPGNYFPNYSSLWAGKYRGYAICRQW